MQCGRLLVNWNQPVLARYLCRSRDLWKLPGSFIASGLKWDDASDELTIAYDSAFAHAPSVSARSTHVEGLLHAIYIASEAAQSPVINTRSLDWQTPGHKARWKCDRLLVSPWP